MELFKVVLICKVHRWDWGGVSIYSTKILQRKSEILEGLGIFALWSVRSYFAGQLSWGGAGCPASS